MQSLVPVAARSKACVYGPSLARTATSNPSGGMVVCLVCCQVEVCASGWSLVQGSTTERGVSECNHAITWSCTSCYIFVFFYRSSWQTTGSVSIANRLRAWWLTNRGLIPDKGRNFSPSHGIQTSPGVYPPFYWMDAGNCSVGDKVAGTLTD